MKCEFRPKNDDQNILYISGFKTIYEYLKINEVRLLVREIVSNDIVKDITDSELEKITSKIENEICSAKINISKTTVYKVSLDIRRLLLNFSQRNRIIFIESLMDRGCWEIMVKLLGFAWREQEEEIVKEITWIFQIIFGSNTDIIAEIMYLGILPLYEKILASDHSEILENIIWGYANLVADNCSIRNLFADLSVLDNIYQVVMKKIEKEKKFRLVKSFIIFLNYYFSSEPHLTFESVKYYLMTCIKLFIVLSREDYEEVESELFDFIITATSIPSQEEIEVIYSSKTWNAFASKLVELLKDKKIEIVKSVILILQNLTYHSHKNLDIFMKINLIEIIKEKIVSKTAYVHCVNLVSNIASIKQEFAELIVEASIFKSILNHIKLNDFNHDEISASLDAVHTISANYDSEKITNFAFNNMESFADIIMKINLKLPFKCVKRIAKIVETWFMLGDFYKLNKGEKENPFVEFVYNSPEVTQAIEYTQMYKNSEVQRLFYNIIKKYFDIS